MSHKNSDNRRTKSQIKSGFAAKKQAKLFALQKYITIIAMLVLLVVGLVSTTFASFIPENTGESGSLVTDIQTLAVNQGHKVDLADTKANVDLADTSYDISSGSRIYYIDTASWNACQMYIWKDSDGYNTYYTLNKIANTKIYQYNFSGGWGGYSGFKFRSDSNWSKQSSGDIKVNVTGNTWFYGTSTTGRTNMDGLNGEANVVTMISTDGGATYTATANPSVYTTVSGYNVASGASVTTNVSASTTSSSSASIEAAYGSTITYKANATGATFKGFSTTNSSALPSSMVSTASTYTKTATGYNTTNNTTYYAYYIIAPTYTISAGTGGTVSPSGTGSASAGFSVTATPSADYTFYQWQVTNGTVTSTATATTTFTPTTNGATLKAIFRPNAPSKLTLTASNVASGTSGTGTSANPYIVFKNGGFTLTANATVPSGSTAYYCATSGGTYLSTKTFYPATTTTGTVQSYSVYAKSFANSLFSANYTSATAYYMAFTHLSEATTGFTMSSDSITDAESVTLSGAYVNDVADAEKSYITQSYQVSTDNSTFTDITGDTWTPDAVGTYYFRVKTTNTKTNEVVYSSSTELTVVKSTVYYNITVVRATGSSTADAVLKTNGTIITDNQILSNEPLTLSLVRTNATPSNYYFTYIKVTDGTNSWNISNLNGDLQDTLVLEHIKGNVTIEYYTTVKPLVQPAIPTNADSISFKYMSDGVEKTGTTAGNYYVDYNSNISYSVIPKTGYYVSSMTGVDIGTITSSTVTGTKNNIIANVGTVTATLTANNTVTVNIDNTSASTDGASMTIDGNAVAFGTAKALNYGAETTVVITPPDGYYAVVSGNSVQSTISTDGKATFKVTLTGANKTYTVKFVENPKIYMVQPQYGSVYVTDGAGNYYFNGDSVGYGTELTVNVKPDHSNAKLSQVLVNNASIGTTDGSKFKIYEDSTATATITVDSKFTFANNTAYGTRRIFFTDNAGWGDGNVIVHYSNVSGDTDFTKNTVTMTYKYTNDMNQRVYTADIPFSAKYVNFYKKSDTTKYSASALIDNDNNAFYISASTVPYPIYDWEFNYSDYVATDRADTIQQGITAKGEAVTFKYTCDFGDDTLSAEKVAGNAITYDFDKGTLFITPTENTYDYSLVKVTSAASTTVKYYLIKVENFEIVSFSGLQKIYSTSVFNNIQLDLILKGGSLNYAAKYMVSDSNIAGTYSELSGKLSGFEHFGSIEGYINSFLIEYAINSVSGVKYYKVEASDGANHKATKTMKTLFGTNSYMGERCLYFRNDTNVNLSKYNLRACFFDENNNYTWVTMQRVGNTDYYRATIPDGFDSKVNFYLCNKNTFSNDIQYFDGEDDTSDYYTFGVLNSDIPKTDDANIVFAVSSISTENGIEGQFAEFN